MVQAIEKVPAETRWEIATKALTGATHMESKALRDALGQDRYNEVIAQIWAEQGKASKEIADALGLTVDDVKSVTDAFQLIVTVAMGPEMKMETVEAAPDRVVLKNTECPWWNRQQEMEIPGDLCSVADPAFCNALAKSFNPKLNVALTKARPRGDSFCEWIYELKT